MTDKKPIPSIASIFFKNFQDFMKLTSGNVSLSRELAKDVFQAMLIAQQKPKANSPLEMFERMWNDNGENGGTA